MYTFQHLYRNQASSATLPRFQAFCSLTFVCVFSSGMKLFSIVSLMLSAKISLAKVSSLDRLLRPALTQQDDWFLHFDRLFKLSSLDVDKPSEFLCVTVWKYELQNVNTDGTKHFNRLQYEPHPSYGFIFPFTPPSVCSVPAPGGG